MKKTLKRIMASVLTLVMLLTAAPLAVSALSESETLDYLTYEINDGEVTITDCDTSISGELTIPSTIEGYPVTNIGIYAFSSCTGLTSITIPDSVTSIGGDVFSGCTGLTSITIGNSVTSIGSMAFYDCTGLTNITIPDSVTSIGCRAFENCISLTSITIPDSVISIESSAFSHCTGLTSIAIGKNVTDISHDAFFDCISLTSFYVSQNNEYYSNDEFGVLYNKDKTELIQYPIGNPRESFVIPNSVSTIGSYAFSGCNILTSIAIPDSVTSIGYSAFEYCVGFTSIIIPNSVTCIDEFVFYGCTGLTSIEIPDSVTTIGYSAFYRCKSLTSITIPDSVTNIGNYSFYYCTGLTSVKIGKSVTSIGERAFYYCDSLANVTLPKSVTSIGDYAFGGCSSITSISIPDNVTSIGENAFYYCNSLISFYVSQNNEHYSNDEFGVLYNKDKTELIQYPNGNDSESFIIPASVTSIGNDALFNCRNLKSISVAQNNECYSNDEFGVLYNKDKTKLIQYPVGNARRSFKIPDSVTTIGGSAFRYCSNLTSVIIPDNVTAIGNHAFSDCSSLISVKIPNNLDTIRYFAFSNCISLESVIMPNSVTSIFHGGFFGCSSLKNVYYTGSKEDWENIYLEGENNPLTKAIIHFNYVENKEYKDEKTGILIDIPSGTFYGNVTLKVEEVLSGSSFDIIEKISGKTHSKVFSIETYVNGESVQPNGEVTVKIPIPDGFNAEKCKLYYLNASTKNPEEIATTVENGYIVFKTNHFSDWAIVQLAGEPTVSVDDIEMNYKKTATINTVIEVDDVVNYTVEYSSSDPSVAKVDENGNVYGAKKGSADITVTVTDEFGNTVTDTCNVQVKYSFGQWLIVILLFGWIWY